MRPRSWLEPSFLSVQLGFRSSDFRALYETLLSLRFERTRRVLASDSFQELVQEDLLIRRTALHPVAIRASPQDDFRFTLDTVDRGVVTFTVPMSEEPWFLAEAHARFPATPEEEDENETGVSQQSVKSRVVPVLWYQANHKTQFLSLWSMFLCQHVLSLETPYASDMFYVFSPLVAITYIDESSDHETSASEKRKHETSDDDDDDEVGIQNMVLLSLGVKFLKDHVFRSRRELLLRLCQMACLIDKVQSRFRLMYESLSWNDIGILQHRHPKRMVYTFENGEEMVLTSTEECVLLHTHASNLELGSIGPGQGTRLVLHEHPDQPYVPSRNLHSLLYDTAMRLEELRNRVNLTDDEDYDTYTTLLSWADLSFAPHHVKNYVCEQEMLPATAGMKWYGMLQKISTYE